MAHWFCWKVRIAHYYTGKGPHYWCWELTTPKQRHIIRGVFNSYRYISAAAALRGVRRYANKNAYAIDEAGIQYVPEQE